MAAASKILPLSALCLKGKASWQLQQQFCASICCLHCCTSVIFHGILQNRFRATPVTRCKGWSSKCASPVCHGNAARSTGSETVRPAGTGILSPRTAGGLTPGFDGVVRPIASLSSRFHPSPTQLDTTFFTSPSSSKRQQELPRRGPRQLTVAVDIDEVLGSFLAALNSFVAEHFFTHHKLSDYYVYNFKEVWKCTHLEAVQRVYAFFGSEHFNNGILPIPGAYQSLLQLSTYCRLFVVTSRQNVIKAKTLAWIERHYSGIFKEVHFGNHFALEGKSRSKSEICRFLGADILVDDNPRYALDCAENGIEVLLFDYNCSYPWSKTPDSCLHPLITRVHDWQEVEVALRSRLSLEKK